MAGGERYIQKYTMIPTMTGTCEGAILIESISGGSAPYTITVQGAADGPNYNFTSTKANVYNLCEGSYSVAIVDANGATNSLPEWVGVSAHTYPTISAAVTTTACTTNQNKYCDMTIWSAGTNWESHEAILKRAYNYNLYKDGELIRTMRVNSGNTHQTFSGLTNGQYYLGISDDAPHVYEYDTGTNWATACCSGANATYSGALFLSATTSAYTINTQFAPGAWYPDWSWSPSPPTKQQTGLYYNGIITDQPNMWFFTGNSTTGELNPIDYTISNPNSGRTTNTDRLWYLGIRGQTMVPGTNQGPTGTEGGKDLSGGTITGKDYTGTFYYNPYIEKFVVWTVLSGSTGYGWMTLNPTTPNYNISPIPFVGSLPVGGDPSMPSAYLPNPISADTVASINTNIAADTDNATFQYSGTDLGMYYTIDYADGQVKDWDEVGQTDNPLADGDCKPLILHQNATGYIASAVTQTFLSPCEYLDYTFETNYGQSGLTNPTSGIVLAAKTDKKGYYGPKGLTHILSLEFNVASGATVYYNRGGMEAYSFQRDLYGTYKTEEGVTTNPYSVKSVVGYREFESKVIGIDGPYTATTATLWKQGFIRIKVTRSGSQGEDFKIEMTDSMGNTSDIQTEATVSQPELNTFRTYFTMNFSLIDTSTWVDVEGGNKHAPSWATGTELLKFLGGVKYGYIGDCSGTTWFNSVFTGTCGSYSLVDGDWRATTNSGVTLTTTDTNHVIKTKNSCLFDPKCTPHIPQIRPRMEGYLQSFITPDIFISGGSKGYDRLEQLKIYNLSADTSAPFNFIYTGDTSDMTLKRLYPQLNIHRYDANQKRFALVADYKYILDNLEPITGVTYDEFYGMIGYGMSSLDYSATTYIPFSALSTGSSSEYIIKSNFISKDKTTTEPVWVETHQNLDEVIFDATTDSYFVLVNHPPAPQLNIAGLDYSDNPGCRLVYQNYVVKGVPAFDSNSAFTYSAITLNFEPTSKIIVVTNGLTLKQANSNEFYSLSGLSQTGDYMIQKNRLYFAPTSVKDEDLISLIYPADKGRSYHNQSVTVGIPGTGSGSTIYQNGTYYFINLDYEAVGATVIALNGTILQETKDFVRVGDKLIQVLKPLYNKVFGLKPTDVLNLYYLTQYLVVGNASVKTPQLIVQYDKTLNYIEEIELNVRDILGNTVQKLTKKMKLGDYGTKAFTFTITVPYPGTYTYNVISKRQYHLMIGKTLTLNNTTRDIRFVMDSAVFYSPYNLPTTATGSTVSWN